METPEERAERLRRKRRSGKVGEYMRSIGQPLLTKDIEEVQRRLRQMHLAGGMSSTAMANQSGVTRDIISALIVGVRRYDHRGPDGELGRVISQMRSSTIKRLLAIEYVPPRSDTNRDGARLPSHGKRRRLQALIAAGYTATFIAEQLDMGKYGNRNLNMFMHGTKGKNFAFAASVFRVAQLYDKLSCARPEDHPIPPDRVKASRTFARKHGWAPPGCWDDDTIDDPDAFPEWTGACGTPEGYAIHLREKIKVCEPCKASLADERGMDGHFSGEKLRTLMEQRGVTVQHLANELGVDPDAARRWVNNQRNPRPVYVKTMAHLLGCEPRELFVESAGELVFEEDFNRHRFWATVQERWEGTQRSLANAMGVSHTAIGKWREGHTTPQISTIRKAADVLGVDWKEFYR
jgi:transcriptional regulator with XRE-family HTH domain